MSPVPPRSPLNEFAREMRIKHPKLNKQVRKKLKLSKSAVRYTTALTVTGTISGTITALIVHAILNSDSESEAIANMQKQLEILEEKHEAANESSIVANTRLQAWMAMVNSTRAEQVGQGVNG